MSERETTHRMVKHLSDLLAQEPPDDAGGHPSEEMHRIVGRRYADWERQCSAWRTLLAPRLIREALQDLAMQPDPWAPAPEPSKDPSYCPEDGCYAAAGTDHTCPEPPF